MNEDAIRRDKICPYLKSAEEGKMCCCMGSICGIYDKDNEQCGLLTLIQNTRNLIPTVNESEKGE